MPEFSIRFLGLFDTVASFGLAGNGINIGYDLSLAGNVERVFHAISFDEDRYAFPATNIRDRRATQTAFTGVHSDIGGGWELDFAAGGLSDDAFIWMRKNMQQYGVQFRNWRNAQPSFNDPTPNDEMPWVLAGGFVAGQLDRPTVEQGQSFALPLAMYARDIDFSRVDAGDIAAAESGAISRWIQLTRLRSLGIGFKAGKPIAQPSFWVIGAANFHFGLGLIQTHIALIEYYTNRIDDR